MFLKVELFFEVGFAFTCVSLTHQDVVDQRLIGPGVVEGRGHVDVSIHQDEQRPLKTAGGKGQPDAEESGPNRLRLLCDRYLSAV